MPLHLNTVNAAIRKAGLRVIAVRGDGYYYFHTSEGAPIDESSVYVFRAHELSLSQWFEVAEKAVGLAAEQEI